MTDTLRTRIAAAAANAHYSDAWDNADRDDRQYWLTVADAVIAELGLEPQPHPGPDFAFHRWVTDWVADERG